MTRRTILVSGLLAAGLAGCSGTRPAADMNEVSGTVTLAGKPADKLMMNLTPLTPGQGREDDTLVRNGEFRVKLIAGKYRVAFTPTPGGPTVPKPYRTADTSGLELDATKPGQATFELK